MFQGSYVYAHYEIGFLLHLLSSKFKSSCITLVYSQVKYNDTREAGQYLVIISVILASAVLTYVKLIKLSCTVVIATPTINIIVISLLMVICLTHRTF